MNRKQLIKKYIDFFKSKDHKEIPNSPLIPENDPTVLFTTAGMHPLVPYLLGQKHPQGKRLVNNQKCIRTTDIEEVGDNCHHTFLEMLGNWSLGDYWKQEAIEMTLEFLTKILKIPKEKISVTCFKGNKNAPKDTEAAKIWESLGIPKQRIKFLEKDNWWETAGPGPCGPCTEMFIDNIEIGNDVLMQYNKDKKGKYNLAKQKNIDFGGGVERTLTILQGFDDNYLTQIWKPIIKKIEQLSKKKYENNKKPMRIIADHIKASVMILNEKIVPGNTEQGYVLRRLIRRSIRYAKKLNINSIIEISEPVFDIYPDYKLDKKFIKQELEKEQKRFLETLEKGLGVFERLTKNKKLLSGKQTFLLYQSYGFPFEITQDLAKEKNIKINEKEFEKELNKHQNLSRTATAGRFKSGLADSGIETTKLHTATHILNQALREVLKKPDLHQKGSNITPERLRFDFNFDRKLTDKEKQDVENLVNKQIKKAIPVKQQEMTLEQAKKQNIQGVFESKYGNKIFVYSIGNFSKEICAGPHVNNTKELGTFKIKKEESSSAGVRRIKATLS
jgi:alanyl-tRNA synthetase